MEIISHRESNLNEYIIASNSRKTLPGNLLSDILKAIFTSSFAALDFHKLYQIIRIIKSFSGPKHDPEPQGTHFGSGWIWTKESDDNNFASSWQARGSN